MLDFLMAVVPARFKTSEQLVSHDLQSNVYNYKVAEGSQDVPLLPLNIHTKTLSSRILSAVPVHILRRDCPCL